MLVRLFPAANGIGAALPEIPKPGVSMEQEELRKLENQCIQEQAPACTAACPVHVDVRAMVREIARGNLKEASKILRKTIPFPGIVGRVCDRPCEAVCKRHDVGSPISIRSLEKACIDWAGDLPPKFITLPGKGKSAAVVGAGMSGLTAAFDLASKGYGVVVFEKNSHPGGSLWRFSEEILPRDVISGDIEALEKVGVKIRLDTTVGKDVLLTELTEKHDAVFIAVGSSPSDTFGLQLGSDGRIEVDPVTFATGREGVFAGGGLSRSTDGLSIIRSISDGRRAAISIDRYLQKVSLTASRIQEGSYTTRLYTSTVGIEPLSTVPMADVQKGYTSEEAVREANRCLQCECLECVKVCEYLHNFKRYPRKYVREIYNNLSIVMGNRTANKLINSCSLCGLCKEVCPGDLHFGSVCKSAREVMMKQGRMPPSAHEFPLRDMEFSNSGKCALARHQPEMTNSAFLFFPGCQLAGSAPEHVRRVYALLSENLSGGVGLMLRCCGAPADWSGRVERFEEAMGDFDKEWREMGKPQLIVACSTCYEIFKSRLPEASISSLWEVLDGLQLPDAADGSSIPEVVAVHDACTTRHERHIHECVRRILQRLGLKLEELPLSGVMTECCGYGGLMFFANRELARAVIRRRIEESPVDYVAYCSMCRDYFAHMGKRTYHLLDLIFGLPAEAAARKGPDYSLRRDNRARLKESLLKDLWGEKSGEETGMETLKLSISDEVRQVMEDRMILVEDILKTVDHAEKSGMKLSSPRTGHFLAHHRPAGVTYWVEYSSRGDELVIHNAYSHRMEIVEDAKP